MAGKRGRSWALISIAALAVAGWHVSHQSGSVPRAALPARPPPGAAEDAVIVEPDAGLAPIDALLGSARRSLDLTMYELADPTIESILAGDAARGVRVRVILDRRLEGARNTPAYEFLRSRGVDARWAGGRYFATHEKAFVVDQQLAVIMSLNFTSSYYANSRDVAVVDRDPADVAAIESVFAADFRGAAIGTPAADDLVWSPGQSEADLVALVAGARRSVGVESEELSSEPMIRALVAAARRGVAVTVAMTYAPQWSAGLDALASAGVLVSLHYGETPLYLHAKLLAIDAGTKDARAFVGSENLSDASLLHDRELGIVLTAARLVEQVASTIAGDVSDGRRWR
ncbi:MAG TPA: phospholipase D-like domain-containing protein [Mycobacteriales bacterium]|nr:phospholipase D-like domain-containing protein [Mycobacteriales bacterium]